MQIFNIGPLEFILILLLAIIVLGPERIVRGARDAGRWVNRMVRSPTWQSILSTSREIRDLPKKIVQETGLEDSLKEIQQTGEEVSQELSRAAAETNQDIQQLNIEVNSEMKTELKGSQPVALSLPESTEFALDAPEQTILPPPATRLAATAGEVTQRESESAQTSVDEVTNHEVATVEISTLETSPIETVVVETAALETSSVMMDELEAPQQTVTPSSDSSGDDLQPPQQSIQTN
jgi:sec-independent protein translocase protein TatB